MSRDAWWIDFLENEVDQSLKQDMEKLLAKSGKDRASLESLANLRQWVADSDPVEDLWSEEKMKGLKLKIDKAIEALPKAKGRRKTSARREDSCSLPDFSNKRPGL